MTQSHVAGRAESETNPQPLTANLLPSDYCCRSYWCLCTNDNDDAMVAMTIMETTHWLTPSIPNNCSIVVNFIPRSHLWFSIHCWFFSRTMNTNDKRQIISRRQLLFAIGGEFGTVSDLELKRTCKTCYSQTKQSIF